MRTRLAITVLAALAAMFGLAGLANAATTPAPQHVAVQGTLIVPDGPDHAHSLAIPAGADAVARPDGLVCIAHPINACGFVFSKSLTENIYNLAIKNGVNAAAAFCVSQLNAHGFGWLTFACNAAADFVKKLADPRGSCLFVGAAGLVPIAVYTHDSCF